VAVVFNTANTPSKREQEIFGDLLQLLWKNCIFAHSGITTFYREMFTVVVTSTPDQRQEWLRKVRKVVNDYFPGYAGNRSID
jgi:NAD(P)H dehydrogenase (quinone)